jgi:hypothetical protein
VKSLSNALESKRAGLKGYAHSSLRVRKRDRPAIRPRSHQETSLLGLCEFRVNPRRTTRPLDAHALVPFAWRRQAGSQASPFCRTACGSSGDRKNKNNKKPSDRPALRPLRCKMPARAGTGREDISPQPPAAPPRQPCLKSSKNAADSHTQRAQLDLSPFGVPRPVYPNHGRIWDPNAPNPRVYPRPYG